MICDPLSTTFAVPAFGIMELTWALADEAKNNSANTIKGDRPDRTQPGKSLSLFANFYIRVNTCIFFFRRVAFPGDGGLCSSP